MNIVGESIVVAIITGLFAVLSQLLISRQSNKDLFMKLDKESALSEMKLDAKLDRHQAVSDMKIEALTREVREHNNFARRVPILEEKVANLERKGS